MHCFPLLLPVPLESPPRCAAAPAGLAMTPGLGCGDDDLIRRGRSLLRDRDSPSRRSTSTIAGQRAPRAVRVRVPASTGPPADRRQPTAGTARLVRRFGPSSRGRRSWEHGPRPGCSERDSSARRRRGLAARRGGRVGRCVPPTASRSCGRAQAAACHVLISIGDRSTKRVPPRCGDVEPDHRLIVVHAVKGQFGPCSVDPSLEEVAERPSESVRRTALADGRPEPCSAPLTPARSASGSHRASPADPHPGATPRSSR
jgi:hypothetical protein